MHHGLMAYGSWEETVYRSSNWACLSGKFWMSRPLYVGKDPIFLKSTVAILMAKPRQRCHTMESACAVLPLLSSPACVMSLARRCGFRESIGEGSSILLNVGVLTFRAPSFLIFYTAY